MRAPELESTNSAPHHRGSAATRWRLLTIAASIGVGCLINLAVAWFFAVWAPMPDGLRYTAKDHGPWSRVAGVPSDWPQPNVIVVRRLAGRAMWQFNYCLDLNSSAIHAGDYTCQLNRAGWPMLSMESQFVYPFGPNQLNRRGHSAGIVVTKLPRPWMIVGNAYSDCVPLRPIWFGFVVNTALFGALVYGMQLGVVRRLRSRRRKHGFCQWCGYDVRGLPRCPECGAIAAEAGPRSTIPA